MTTTHPPDPLDWRAAYRGKTVLITGATGYIGAALGQALRAAAGHVLLLVRPQSYDQLPPLDDERTTVVAGDLADADTWRHVVPGVDYIFHLASHRHYFGFQPNPLLDLSVNALSMLQLLECCAKERFPPKIIFASTSTLARHSETLPVDESAPDDPPTLYAIHKSTAERYLQLYWREQRVPSVSLRLANVYGPSPYGDPARRNTLNLLIRRALHGETLLLFRNHSCLRDYLFIEDAVSAFLLAGACEALYDGSAFVIGSGVGQSIGGAISLIADRTAMRTGRRPPITAHMDLPIEPVGWRQFVADTARFRAATGWAAAVSLAEGIDCTLDYFLSKDMLHAVDCAGLEAV